MLALVVGSFSLRRIRRDYQAAILLIVSLIAIGLVSNVVGLVNGSNGLTGIPKPLSGVLASLSYDNYQWVYAAWTGVIAVAVYLLVARLGRSGWGRALRAVRDHEDAAATISLNPAGLRMQAFVLGGMIAGLSGGLLVEFLAAWSPGRMGVRGDIRRVHGHHPGRRREQLGGGARHAPGAGDLPAGADVPAGGRLHRAHRRAAVGADRDPVAGLPRDPPARPAPRKALPRRPVPAAGRPRACACASPPGRRAVAASVARACVRGHAGGPGGEPPCDCPRATATVLEVRDVSVRFGGVEAVRDVTLQVSAGEVVGLIGPNGAGKSSLLGALGGQFAVASGRVLLSGHDVTSLPPYRRARLGLVRTFQHTSTFDGLTVFENLLVSAMSARGSRLRDSLAGQRARQAEAAEAVWERLREFELTAMADKYGSELSGGQRRLVEIMRCLMQSPQVLLLDEPMVGVAPHLVERISDDCARISESGVAVVIVEHALEVIQAVCGRVVVMASGQVVAQASYAEAMSSGAVQEAYFL